MHTYALLFKKIMQKTALVPQDLVLLLSTLDGSLIAVSKNTGKIVWSLKEGL